VEKFNIVLAPKAVKDLDDLNDKQCAKILKQIRVLEENPFPRGKLIKKLKGTIDRYRVFFRIEAIKIIILRILSKKDVEKIIKTFK